MSARVWLLGVGLCAGLATGTAAWAGPQLRVSEVLYDFGEVEQGAPVDHAFRIVNAGDAPLRLENVKSTCHCTVGAATGTDVAPGDFAYVTVRLDTAKLSGRTTKAVTVYTNDPVTPVQSLALTGSVVTDLVLAPSAVYVGHVPLGVSARREIVVRPGRSDAWPAIERIDTDSPMITARVEAGPDDRSQKLVVELSPDMPAGRFDGAVTLKTSSPRQPTLTVPVFGTVDTTLAVLPPQVTFGIASSGRTEPHDVRIRNRGRRPLAVTKVVAPPSVEAQLETVREGVEWRLTLTLLDPHTDVPADAAVDIFTDLPGSEHLRVPVYTIDRRRG
jgi:hypothetical protein